MLDGTNVDNVIYHNDIRGLPQASAVLQELVMTPPNPAVSPAAASDDALRTETTLGLIGYKLRRAQLSVFQRFLTTFEHLNLRPAEYSVLVLVEENPGRKQSEIALLLGIKRANFVPLVDGLENRGLIARAVIETDRRANGLHMTEEGKAFMANARAVHTELEAELVSRLGGGAERDQLLTLLDRLT
jgi:DNA-binding MarR family transcriptional regulator